MSEQKNTKNISRRTSLNDLHRPQYHFTPPQNWMNDPNGLIFWRGRYHLFYQHNPDAPYWGNMHWGHAVSEDLIHWRDLPIALAPDPNGPDSAGCFSGCAIEVNNTATIIYTGTQGADCEIQTQCLATAVDDDLIKWKKHAKNPIISDVPSFLHQSRDFRDPFVWHMDGNWYMVLGSRIGDQEGAILLYKSNDLEHWEFQDTLLTGQAETFGSPWECPNFFPLGEKWVLIVSSLSPENRVYAFVGTFIDEQFHVETQTRLNWGSFYAPLSFVDENSRRILFGWVLEDRDREAQIAAGWSGAQTLPRELTLAEDGRLLQKPVVEVENLRDKLLLNAETINSEKTLIASSNNCYEIVATVRPQGTIKFRLCSAPNDSEFTELIVDTQQKSVTVVRTHSSFSTNVNKAELKTYMESIPDTHMQLRIFVDRSIVEIFVDDTLCLTTRVYPTQLQSSAIKLSEGHQLIKNLAIWELKSIWS